MQHKQAIQLLESYVLGALDADELAAVEGHISTGCKDCEATLIELGEVTVGLAESVPQHTPAAHLKEKLLNRVAGEQARVARPPFRVSRYQGWVAAGVAILLLLVVTIRSYRLSGEVARLEAELAELEDVTALLGSPAMQFIELNGVAPNTQAFGKIVIDPERGRGLVYMYRLPQTPEGMQYQFWVLREGVPTSAGLFTVSDNGSAVLELTGLPDPAFIASFTVTLEPASGLVVPSGMMYLTGPSDQ